ncbi:MAG: DUF308 domain-containing protein [Firmicutes bacterium]|nr:DUF308 domain-containing protein [Bacillota bacterium]
MRKLLRIRSKHVYLISTFYTVLGIFLLLFNQDKLLSISFYAGIVMMLAGIGLIVTYFQKKTNVNIFVFGGGIVLLVIGFVFFALSDLILKYLPYFVAVILILHSVDEIYEAINLRRYKYKHWIPITVWACLVIFFSIIIFFQFFKDLNILLVIVGIALILQSLFNLIMESILVNQTH